MGINFFLRKFLTNKSGGNSGGNKSRLCKRAYDFHRKPLNFLVAGAGFEPTTFGL